MVIYNVYSKYKACNHLSFTNTRPESFEIWDFSFLFEYLYSLMILKFYSAKNFRFWLFGIDLVK